MQGTQNKFNNMLYDKTKISQAFYSQVIVTSSRVTDFNKFTSNNSSRSQKIQNIIFN